ncbi:MULTISPECIES: sensor histidine kinase [unclassified Curtobacterium]|uniref:sensor histidine kinase n=1 Tax=unclassified Curtobacterium TaxID=257496 RepID=UPI001611952E|nr:MULTISPECIES: histidine kinase [unclassified Curtobacterium]
MTPLERSNVPPRSWMRGGRTLYLVTGGAISAAIIAEAIRVGSERPVPLGGALAVVLLAVGSVMSLRFPHIGLLIASCAALTAGVFGWEPLVEWSCAVFLLFAVTLRRGRPILMAVSTAIPVVIGTLSSRELGDPIATTIGVVISIGAGAGIAFGLRSQTQYRFALEQRAEDAVATREVEAQRRVAEERLRIARDLHDVVGHEVAVVSMNIGVAEVVLPEDATQAREALRNARTGIRNVLNETQRILELLRTAEDHPGSAPTPGLTLIPDLIESYRQIGLRVDADLRVDVDAEVSGSVGVTLYRVLQETLTNAHRYGRGSATVSCWSSPGRVHLEVRNAPHDDRRQSGSGLGLIGLRERISQAGGTVTIDGNSVVFVVSVELPTTDGLPT